MASKVPPNSNSQTRTSVHLSDKLIYVGFPIAEVSTFHIMLELACPPAASGVGKFKRPKEVRHLLGREVRINAQSIFMTHWPV